MASNKHAQIRYKVLDDCFSNFHRKFYFDDLLERCNEAFRELYGKSISLSDPDFSIFKRGLGGNDLAQLKETIMMLQNLNCANQ